MHTVGKAAGALLAVGVLFLTGCGSTTKNSAAVLGVSSSTPIPPADTPAPTVAASAGTGSASPVSAGNGQSVSPTAPASPSPAPQPTVTTTATTVRITQADSGRTFVVALGTHLEISLAPDGSGSYDPPQTNRPAVLREDSHHGGYPDHSAAEAIFTAIAPGSAQITSQTDVACLHTTPRCLPPQRGFSVTISVH